MLKKLSTKILIENEYIRLFEDEIEIEGEGGTRSKYYYMNNHNYVHGLGLTKDKASLVLSIQFRYPLGKEILNVPGGAIDMDENPEDAAMRELFEETGYKGSNIVRLGNISIDPAKSANWLEEFLILDCEKVGIPHGGDTNEKTEPFLLPVAEAWDYVKTNKIEGSQSLSTLVKSLLYLGIKN